MRTFLLILFVIPFSLFFAHAKNSEKLELNMTLVDGFLPERSSSSGVTWWDDLSEDKQYKQVTNIPSEWKNPKNAQIQINLMQLIYQGVQNGKFPKELLKDASDNLFIEIDTTYLTEKNIRCCVSLAFGKDEKGNTLYVIDADNNQNFENDSVFMIDKSFDYRILSTEELFKHTKNVTIERYANSRLDTEFLPLLIFYDENLGEINYSIPLHMATSWQVNSQKYDLTVDFSDRDDSDLFIKSADSDKTKISCQHGELFEIEGKTFKYNGVNVLKRTLKLEEVKD